MKRLDLIIIDVKNNEDFRPFIICFDSDGVQWELRGVGQTTPEDAFNHALHIWNTTEEQDWDLWGYLI